MSVCLFVRVSVCLFFRVSVCLSVRVSVCLSVRVSVCLSVRPFQTKVVQKIKTHILCSVTFFFRKSSRYKIMWKKYCRAGQATDDNMAHAHCLLGYQRYKHTFTICNTDCFSTTTMLAGTRIIVSFYVHRQSPGIFRSQFLCKLPVAVPFQTRNLQAPDVPPGDALPIFPSVCFCTHKSRLSLFCVLFLRVQFVMRRATVM